MQTMMMKKTMRKTPAMKKTIERVMKRKKMTRKQTRMRTTDRVLQVIQPRALPRHRGMLGRQTRPMSISRTMARALPARTREVTAPASYATIVAARLSR
jgi:hypothetical protein